MKITNYILILATTVIILGCQPYIEKKLIDVSLAMKQSPEQIPKIDSDEADLYQQVLHHAPAIENEFFCLRLYFNNSGAIDVYSKQKQQLELEKAKWYPDSLMQAQGYGSDQYKVGSTTGLGGIKLWDGEKSIDLVASRGRWAKVSTNNISSTMEMLAKGVVYKTDTINVLIKVTVVVKDRWAQVEASVSGNKMVEFVTGVNYHSSSISFHHPGLIGTWGIHPEDVALKPEELGAALCYNEDDFSKFETTCNQMLLISKPTNSLKIKITSVSEKESEINTIELFKTFTMDCTEANYNIVSF